MKNLDLKIVATFVRRNPGTTCTNAARELGAADSVGYVGSLLRELRARGDVRSRGNTKGTRYYAR